MIWFDDLTKNEHDLIWRWFDLTKVLTNWFDLRFDLIKILSRWFDLRFDLTHFLRPWFDLRFDLTTFFKPLIWFEIWVISLDTLLLCTFESLDYPYYLGLTTNKFSTLATKTLCFWACPGMATRVASGRSQSDRNSSFWETLEL